MPEGGFIPSNRNVPGRWEVNLSTFLGCSTVPFCSLLSVSFYCSLCKWVPVLLQAHHSYWTGFDSVSTALWLSLLWTSCWHKCHLVKVYNLSEKSMSGGREFSLEMYLPGSHAPFLCDWAEKAGIKHSNLSPSSTPSWPHLQHSLTK